MCRLSQDPPRLLSRLARSTCPVIVSLLSFVFAACSDGRPLFCCQCCCSVMTSARPTAAALSPSCGLRVPCTDCTPSSGCLRVRVRANSQQFCLHLGLSNCMWCRYLLCHSLCMGSVCISRSLPCCSIQRFVQGVHVSGTQHPSGVVTCGSATQGCPAYVACTYGCNYGKTVVSNTCCVAHCRQHLAV